MGQVPPGPQPAENGLLPAELPTDPLKRLSYLSAQYGDLVRCPSRYGQSYLYNHPDQVRHFLHSPNYQRTELLKIALGEGSLSADGPPWRKRRRIVQPAFERARIKAFGAMMVEETEALLDDWDQAQGPVDVDEAMMRLTLTIAVRALFSTDISEHVEVISQSLTTVIADLGALTSTLFDIPVAFGPRRNRELKAALGAINQVVYQIIERRRQNPGAPDSDLLSMLLHAKDAETGDMLSDEDLRDEVVTMLVAGHETTATMLAWAWYLLSENPEVERKFHQEIDNKYLERLPETEDMMQPNYVRYVAQEALRLYPPVWAVARRVLEDEQLAGYQIKGKSAAFICPFILHRHPEYWPEPELFKPERFEPEAEAKIDRYAYVPFVRGPHMCTGHHFAMLEGQLILATIGRRYAPKMVEGHLVEPLPLVTLRHKNGLPMHLHARKRGRA